MAIPKLLQYKNEHDFIEAFVVPLLGRLGFSLVVNYHGHAELGKDLVFGEVDRFGHVRYHACQAKYVPSISLNAIEGLVRDAKQAFNNPFAHPQTGAVERISTFYAVTAGTVGPEATQHYFNSLCPAYGDNVRLLQAKDLLLLDQSASASRRDAVTESLSGMLLEVRYNRRQVGAMGTAFRKSLDGGSGALFFNQLRLNATSRYLTTPLLPVLLPVDLVQNYWHFASVIGNWASVHSLRGINSKGQEDLAWATFDKLRQALEDSAASVEASILAALEQFDPS